MEQQPKTIESVKIEEAKPVTPIAVTPKPVVAPVTQKVQLNQQNNQNQPRQQGAGQGNNNQNQPRQQGGGQGNNNQNQNRQQGGVQGNNNQNPNIQQGGG